VTEEAQLQSDVIKLAKWAGWVHFHVYDSRRSPKGFPDLVLVHRESGRLLFVELKSRTGRVSPDQRIWLALLGKRHEVGLWTPEQWRDGTIRRALTEGRAVNAA
jgi:hypothetical protein